MINVGITGQAGFIGTHLFNYLSLFEEKYSLIPFEDSFFEDQLSMHAFVKQCDVIFHFAAVNRHHDIETLYKTNISLVNKLISAMEGTGSKAHIFFSSSTQEVRENVYGNSKKAGREILIKWAEKTNSGFTGLIIPNVFGPFGRPGYNSVISTFSHKLIHGDSPVIDVDATLNLIYVGELVAYCESCLQKPMSVITKGVHVPYTSTITVSDILKLLSEYKTEYIGQGTIPELKTAFEINLFNTFRSYINYAAFFPFKYKLNTDQRGTFVETMRLKVGGQISFSTTVPGITRGNHFHTRKIERFAVIKGKARIQLRKIGADQIINLFLDGSEPSFVDMPIWYTHNISNIGEDELLTLFWINEFYDPTAPDTYYSTV